MKEYVKPLLTGLSAGAGLAVVVGLWEMIETARSATRLNDRDWADLKEIVSNYQWGNDITLKKGTTIVSEKSNNQVIGDIKY